MLPDTCNSDTSTNISDACGEFLPCCGSYTGNAVYAEIHPGSSVKELFRRKGEKIPHLHCNSVECAHSRNCIKKPASKPAYQRKRRCHHQRSPLKYDLYVLNSEESDTDTSSKTPKEPKDAEVRKTRSSDEPTESTSRHTRRVLPVKKPSLLCVPRVCQPEPSLVRHKHTRTRNCRLCHHHYCSWMKEDFLHPGITERGRNSVSSIPEGEVLDVNSLSSLKESVHNEDKKSYTKGEYTSVSSELKALLRKCEREIADTCIQEHPSSKLDVPAPFRLAARVPKSSQRKIDGQTKQIRRELPGQHYNQTNAVSAAESRGTQTKQHLNFNEPSFPKMCYEMNSEEQWFHSQDKTSQKNESSRAFDDERNSVATEGTSEAESHCSTHDIMGIPVQQKPAPVNSPHERKDQEENIFTDYNGKFEREMLEKYYDPKSFYEQDLPFRRGSQGDGPISSNASVADTIVHKQSSSKPRKSRCESHNKSPVLPYCLEPQNVFLATCNRQQCTSAEHPHLKKSPRRSHDQRNKWFENEIHQHQEGYTAGETLAVVTVPLNTFSADTSTSPSPKNAPQDQDVPKSPTEPEKKPGIENPVITDVLEDSDSYLCDVTNESKQQQECAEESKSISESHTAQEKRSARVSKNCRPFKSRSLTSISLPNFQAQAFMSGDYNSWITPMVGLYEGKSDKEEEQINSESSESCGTSVIHTDVQQEIRVFTDRLPYTKHKAQDEPPEGAPAETKFMDSINEATSSKEQIVQLQNAVESNASCTIGETFRNWQDIYKTDTESNTDFKHMLKCLPGEESDYIKELRKLQWKHLKRIKQEIQSLEELVRFLDNCASRRPFSPGSAPV